ncbi:hypothetical protein [Burkholderia sp. LMU1-1-1.1]|uniref:hypothetical protein n=1 Tax=Burkholderia sp. LMU1-1-1.1 TaxID=3135266 RepID=UPI00343A58C5
MSDDAKPMTIPDDFPRGAPVASLPGVQPKLAVIRDSQSGLYVEMRDSMESAAQYVICEDLAEQLSDKCRRNRASKYAHLSEREILEQLRNRLLKSGWGTTAEMEWTIRRTAEKLGWSWAERAE